jgi:uncharacterized protein YabN with tetrapyrrole methylase and pyrophosphatase domain
MKNKSRLVLAGSGIKFASQLTTESLSAIKNSDMVFYLLNDPASEKFISDLAKSSRSLNDIYFSHKSRKDSYSAIVDKILKTVNKCELVTFVNYGHPLFLCDITLDLINRAEADDIDIIKLPGISSFDCIISDLLINVGKDGVQAYEATDFVLNDYQVNTSSNLILWQVGVIGIEQVIRSDSLLNSKQKMDMLEKLQLKLTSFYSSSHPINLYTASMYSHLPFENKSVSISDLLTLNINRLATAYIPPKI